MTLTQYSLMSFVLQNVGETIYFTEIDRICQILSNSWKGLSKKQGGWKVFTENTSKFLGKCFSARWALCNSCWLTRRRASVESRRQLVGGAMLGTSVLPGLASTNLPGLFAILVRFWIKKYVGVFIHICLVIDLWFYKDGDSNDSGNCNDDNRKPERGNKKTLGNDNDCGRLLLPRTPYSS